MGKVLECGSVFPGCEVAIHGDGDDEVMAKAMEHARAQHHATELSQQLRTRMRSAIRDDTAADAGAAKG
ncbi:DUF1059 domain-containing protein [Roseomonas sp. HF4]|uniref:DUF1059 domain-containing protein n=1 Tax=Roseomonas sp. HF4 TaxID=2562313 RepID=UPI0010C0E144|nr:DUF1059 domain-containing protein [Roseomonas sp. HF4]